MKTGGKTSGSGKTVLIAVLVPLGSMAQGGAKGGATTGAQGGTKGPALPKPVQSPQQRVADAMRKAAQSSPAAQAAFRRNPGAAAKIAAHAQTLAAHPGRSPLAALKQGLGVSSGLRSVRRDMVKDFRKGGGEVKTASSHSLSERGQRHAAAAERGLRRGGLGLLSAAWHGTQIMREQRKTLNRERADARAEAKASGKPAPPEGMRTLLGAAVKGIGIAQGLRSGLSEMRRQERMRSQAPSRGEGIGQGASSGTLQTMTLHGSAYLGRIASIDGIGGEQGGADPTRRGEGGHGGTPRVLRATGFALGAMAFGPGGGLGGGTGVESTGIHAVGFALWLPQSQSKSRALSQSTASLDGEAHS